MYLANAVETQDVGVINVEKLPYLGKGRGVLPRLFKLRFIGLFAAEGGLGPLVLRGLAKIGAFVPIFDWGSFYFELPQS